MSRLIPSVLAPGAIASREQPVIPVAENLTLRPWMTSDAAFVLEAFSNSDIERWHFRHYESTAEAEEWIAAEQAGWLAETCASWALTSPAPNSPIGRVAVHVSPNEGTGEVTYWVVPSARRQGAAARATVAATRWAHDIGIHRVQLEHSTQNEVSGMVAMRAGFVREGVRRSATLHADGWHDMMVYSHLATDSAPPADAA
jgi:[ribosomal protein S5]-alanine N-acetyltransferase